MTSAPSAPPPTDLLTAWLDGTGEALAVTDAAGVIGWANDAFQQLVGPVGIVGQRLGSLMRTSGATPLEAIGVTPVELRWTRPDGEAACASITRRPLGTTTGDDARWLLVLVDRRPLRALEAARDKVADRVDMAQRAGHFGLWERLIPSGIGHWDEHMYRLFDLAPTPQAPSAEAAAATLHPDDRDRWLFPQSTGRAGTYSSRFRLVHRDGRLRHVRSVWEVRNGASGRPERAVGVTFDDTETWQLAQSFNEASSQLQLAVDVGRIITWRHDLRSKRMHFNRFGYDTLGLSPQADGLPFDTIVDLIHPGDRRAVFAAAKQAIASGLPADTETRYRRGDGAWRYALTRRVVQRDASGAPAAFIGVALDFTTQMESRHAAMEIARRLELTATAAGIGIWHQNVVTGRIEWNRQMWTLLGLPPQDVPLDFRRWVVRSVHRGDRHRLVREAATWERSKRAGFDTEFRVVHASGEVRWIAARAQAQDLDGTRMLLGVMLDVTARHATETALRDAYERAALAARGAGIGTWERSWDNDTSIWDDQMYRLRGLDPRDGPMTVEERQASVHPDDVAGVIEQQRRASTGDAPVTYEFRVRHADGRWRWLASRAMPVRGEDGRLERLIGVNWDITDAKTSAAARQEAELAVRESRAKTQFLARMSHELRTPLNAVLGFTQLLQADAEDATPARRVQLGHIRAAGEHLLSLINDVLDLSSLESGSAQFELAPVPIEAVVREAHALVSDVAAERQVHIELGVLDGTALAERTRLRQVLVNLLSNATKYNRPGGRVVVVAAQQDGALVVRVSDTGRGMSHEQLAHLFEPFNRLGAEAESIEGTGIGLVIVKMLVERMGGQVHVHSRIGVGSVFELLLQTSQPEARAAYPDEPEPPSQAAADRRAGALPAAPATIGQPVAQVRTGTVLYIEDNPVNTLLVQQLIEHRENLRLLCAVDGGSGVASAVLGQPDLVLVDMQLPDMDGHEVLRRLRADPATASIPCIAVSANALAEDIETALAAGFADYWTKPLDIRAFLGALDAIFAADTPAPVH